MTATTYFIIVGAIIAVCVLLYAIAGNNAILNPILKPVATTLLCLTLLTSGTLGGIEIGQYYSAKGLSIGQKSDPISTTTASFTYIGENYGFAINRFTFASSTDTTMTIVYDPLTIDLTQDYAIFVNNVVVSNINKSTNFIEGDFYYNFYNGTNLQNAIEGVMHVKYVFADKLTVVTLTVNTEAYTYWIKYLKLNNFVTTIKEYTRIENEIPIYTVGTGNTLYSTNTDVTPKLTTYINQNLTASLNAGAKLISGNKITNYLQTDENYTVQLILSPNFYNLIGINSIVGQYSTIINDLDISNLNGNTSLILLTYRRQVSDANFWVWTWGTWHYECEYQIYYFYYTAEELAENTNYGLIINSFSNIQHVAQTRNGLALAGGGVI